MSIGLMINCFRINVRELIVDRPNAVRAPESLAENRANREMELHYEFIASSL